MAETKDHARPLPATLRPDRMVKMPFACRLGWHQWHMTERFGTFGFDYYQGKKCAKCACFKWVRAGYNVR